MTKLEQVARQALEALESYSKSDYIKKQHPKRKANGEKAITALREALAEQAEQRSDSERIEPVAWGVDWGKDGDQPCVSIIKKHSNGTTEVIAVEYSPNPVRTKDLTDDEIESFVSEHRMADYIYRSQAIAMCRAVIAADREKNK